MVARPLRCCRRLYPLSPRWWIGWRQPEELPDGLPLLWTTNLNGALLRVRSAYEGVVLAFGESGTTNILRASFDALADALRAVANNMDIALRVGTALLLALAAPKIAAITAGMIGLTAATGGFTVALGVATTAARFLGRALLIGLAVEVILALVEAFRELNRVVTETPELFEDALVVGIDRFVNSIISALELIGRLILNLAPLVVAPFYAAFIEFGKQLPFLIFDPDSFSFAEAAGDIARAAALAFAEQFSTLVSDFAADFADIGGTDERFIAIASDEQIARVAAAQMGDRGPPRRWPLRLWPQPK